MNIVTIFYTDKVKWALPFMLNIVIQIEGLRPYLPSPMVIHSSWHMSARTHTHTLTPLLTYLEKKKKNITLKVFYMPFIYIKSITLQAFCINLMPIPHKHIVICQENRLPTSSYLFNFQHLNS